MNQSLGLEAEGMTSVEAVYRRIAPIYDVLYGVGLRGGRRRGMAALRPRPGERILELGIGTGLSALDYPAGCRVLGIDLSAPMLARARTRLRERHIGHVSLCRMDAGHLALPDASVDAVYAPYVVNVVPDPALVAREIRRVCRPHARIVLLNHFASPTGVSGLGELLVGGLVSRTSGVNWRLSLDTFLGMAALTLVSYEQVPFSVSSVVVCRPSADGPEQSR